MTWGDVFAEVGLGSVWFMFVLLPSIAVWVLVIPAGLWWLYLKLRVLHPNYAEAKEDKYSWVHKHPWWIQAALVLIWLWSIQYWGYFNGWVKDFLGVY